MIPVRNAVIEHLETQFRDYRPQFLYRPDGSILLKLCNPSGQCVLSRVVQNEEQSSDTLLNGLVERIHRDLVTIDGPLAEKDVDWFLKRIELQTFVPTAPQHRPRKIVRAGAKLRGLAGQAQAH